MTINAAKTEKLKKEIKKALDLLIKGETDNIHICNIVSSNFLELFDLDEPNDFNGWQCDWWSEMRYEGKTIAIFGCAFYGTVDLSIDD